MAQQRGQGRHGRRVALGVPQRQRHGAAVRCRRAMADRARFHTRQGWLVSVAGIGVAFLTFAASGVEVAASTASAFESFGRVVAVRLVEFGERHPPFQPAGGFEALHFRDTQLDTPRAGVPREVGQRSSAKAAGGVPPIAATDKPWCDRLLERLAGTWAAEPVSPESDAAAATTPIHLPDTVLRRAVARALGKSPVDLITRRDMAALRALNPDHGVRQLTGIEWAVNLRQLCVTQSTVSDLAPLAGMASLRDLVLYGDFADLSPLASLASLRYLYLSGQRGGRLDRRATWDLAPLAGLRSLTSLHLTRTAISDLAPLAGITSLTSLGLSLNAISNLANVASLARLPSLTALYLYSSGVAELGPIAGMTQLTHLDLGHNGISDLAPLAGLTSLTWLRLVGNQVADLGPLAGLTALETLHLTTNRISDLGPLAGLTSLTNLYLLDNRVADLRPLAGLGSLTTLELDRNEIVELPPLAGLKSLATLDLSHNDIAELGPLADLESLTTLDLSHNDIAELGPLADLESLTTLDLSHNEVAEVAVAGLGSLAHIDLSVNQIEELGSLAGLESLATLNLSHNELAEFEPMASFTSLRRLWLHGNAISDVAPLAGLTWLTELSLSENEITDLRPLAGLTSLRTLYLGSNEIDDLGPLAGLASMTYLDLGENQVADLRPLAGLASLKQIYLDGNEIADVAPLAALTQLCTLYLDDNRLTTLPPGFFSDVGGLAQLDLDDNPGAPFTLKATPVLSTSAEERPARVAVRIAEGAPFGFDIALDAAGGRLAADASAMAAGALLSETLDVWPAGRQRVVVRVTGVPSSPPFLPDDLVAGCGEVLAFYAGVEFTAGPPLVLNDLAEYSGFEEPADIDLAAAFREFEGLGPLAFAIRTSDSGVAAAERTGTTLRIVPVGPGVATITVTATVADGRTATRVFDITVPGPPPLRGWRWKLLEGR